MLHCLARVRPSSGSTAGSSGPASTTPVAAAVSPERAAPSTPTLGRTAVGLGRPRPADGPAWLDLYRWWRAVGTTFFARCSAAGPADPRSARRAAPGAARATGIFDTTQMQLAPLDASPGTASSTRRPGPSWRPAPRTPTWPSTCPAACPAALILAMVAQQLGMPVPVGGAGRLADALVGAVTEAGGVIRTGPR